MDGRARQPGLGKRCETRWLRHVHLAGPGGLRPAACGLGRHRGSELRATGPPGEQLRRADHPIGATAPAARHRRGQRPAVPIGHQRVGTGRARHQQR